MNEILQKSLPAELCKEVRLPGISPCAQDDWLRVDEVYTAQMAYRTRLLAEKSNDVFWQEHATCPAAEELLSAALEVLPKLGFVQVDKGVQCPDGRTVAIDFGAPLWTLGHLVQEDLCILQEQGDEHVLTAAVLCFPANWRLAEKAGRPLTAIHAPVEEYDGDLARRVQRMFHGVKAGKPLSRHNRLRYATADLHQPHKKVDEQRMPFLRSERQCVLRLPRTNAVVFSIHTWVVRD
jgi:hypothetical protein